MTKEQKYFIAVLRAYLDNSQITLDDSINYAQLFRIAKSHNTAGIVFCVIKNSPNKEIIEPNVYKAFEDSFYDAIYRYDVQEKAINELDALLHKSSINHIFFKGAELKEYYPVAQVRAMGDIDVLIPSQSRDKVKSLLTSNGYKLVNSNGPVYDYNKDGVLFEVHTKIISGKVGNSNAEEGFSDAMQNAVFNEYSGQLNPEYNLAYLLGHIAHHFWFYGAGIKLILDIAVLQKHFNIDINKVLCKMEEIGLGEFSKIILTICAQWFGIGQAFDIDTTSTQEFLLNYGAFGNANRNKAAVIERKELEEGKKNSKFMTKLRLLFPSYNKMKNIPYIKFIEGRPYLTPFAWMYRIIYNLKNRRDFVLDTTAKIGSDETNSEAQKELAYFEEIGLL